MTGRDALKEELQRRGATKAQLNSKLIPWMLEIFSEGREEYIRLYELDREIDDAERKIKRLNADRLEAERELRQLRESAKKERQSLQEFKEELEARIAKFEESLANCESEEGRDAMRTAQLFIDATDVVTKYDNTAYIIGLASILSNGKVGAMETLNKINKRLPSPPKMDDIFWTI